MEIDGEANRPVIDRNAPARLIVTMTRKGDRFAATTEVRDDQGITVYTRQFEPLRSCDNLIIDIGVVLGERFRSDAEEAAEKAAAADQPPARSDASKAGTAEAAGAAGAGPRQPGALADVGAAVAMFFAVRFVLPRLLRRL